MTDLIDIKVLEFLSSKICHDLISPVGAINNGIEIMEELGGDPDTDVTSLITMSAHQASAKLKAYRMAFGAGGADGNIKMSDVYDALNDVLGENARVSQIWDRGGIYFGGMYPNAFCKMIINLLLVASETLPKGGTIDLQCNNTDHVEIICKGDPPRIKDGLEDCLTLNMDKNNLSPQLVHAYICGLFADHYGYIINLQNEGNVLRFNLKVL